jgi:hypothetical protein
MWGSTLCRAGEALLGRIPPLSNNHKKHFRLPSFVETITNNTHAEEGKRQTKRQKVSS